MIPEPAGKFDESQKGISGYAGCVLHIPLS